MTSSATCSVINYDVREHGNLLHCHAGDRRNKCVNAGAPASAAGSKMMSTKAVAFSIAALLGLRSPSSPSSALPTELETSADCSSRDVRARDLDMNSYEIDVGGAEEKQQPASENPTQSIDFPCSAPDFGTHSAVNTSEVRGRPTLILRSAASVTDNVDCGPAVVDDADFRFGADVPTSSERSNSVHCRLETQNLWDRFQRLGLTEMIITKAGRRMFPSVRVNFSGLDPDAEYDVMLDILPVDDRRYRYAYHKSSWVVATDASYSVETDQTDSEFQSGQVATFRHPESPYRGHQLEQRTVSFERVKLTNSADRSGRRYGYIVLNSMRKYRPRIRLIRRPTTAESAAASCQLPQPGIKEFRNYCNENPLNDVFTTASTAATSHSTEEETTLLFPFHDCVFIAVTAYQNQLITKLKIENNPFAKGFREFSRFGRQLEVYGDRKHATTRHSPVLAASESSKPDVISNADYVTTTTTRYALTHAHHTPSQRAALTFKHFRSNPALISMSWGGVVNINL